MFDTLSDRLTGVFDRLRGRGALNEADVREAMREVRIALLEADVALPVVKEFVAAVKERARGEEVSQALNPAQQVVKIVNDELVAMLGGEGAAPLELDVRPPAVIMMVPILLPIADRLNLDQLQATASVFARAFPKLAVVAVCATREATLGTQ